MFGIIRNIGNIGRRYASTMSMNRGIKEGDKLRKLGLSMVASGAAIGFVEGAMISGKTRTPDNDIILSTNIETKRKVVTSYVYSAFGLALGMLPGLIVFRYAGGRKSLINCITRQNATYMVTSFGSGFGAAVGYENAHISEIINKNGKEVGIKMKSHLEVDSINLLSSVLVGSFIGGTPGSIMTFAVKMLSPAAYFKFIAGFGLVISGFISFASATNEINTLMKNNDWPNEDALYRMRVNLLASCVGGLLIPASFLTPAAPLGAASIAGIILYTIVNDYNNAHDAVDPDDTE